MTGPLPVFFCGGDVVVDHVEDSDGDIDDIVVIDCCVIGGSGITMDDWNEDGGTETDCPTDPRDGSSISGDCRNDDGEGDNGCISCGGGGTQGGFRIGIFGGKGGGGCDGEGVDEVGSKRDADDNGKSDGDGIDEVGSRRNADDNGKSDGEGVDEVGSKRYTDDNGKSDGDGDVDDKVDDQGDNDADNDAECDGDGVRVDCSVGDRKIDFGGEICGSWGGAGVDEDEVESNTEDGGAWDKVRVGEECCGSNATGSGSGGKKIGRGWTICGSWGADGVDKNEADSKAGDDLEYDGDSVREDSSDVTCADNGPGGRIIGRGRIICGSWGGDGGVDDEADNAEDGQVDGDGVSVDSDDVKGDCAEDGARIAMTHSENIASATERHQKCIKRKMMNKSLNLETPKPRKVTLANQIKKKHQTESAKKVRS